MATESMIKRIKEFNDIRDELVSAFDYTKEHIDDIEINDLDLDGESLRTPVLYNKYLVLYSKLLEQQDKLNDVKNKVYLERWKYYQRKQTNNYYAEYGILNDAVLKTDLDVYLKADELMIAISDCYNIIKQHTQYVERIMKEISNRGFHIKTAVEWRKFQMGSV